MTSDEQVTIEEEWQIYRGYENLEKKIKGLR
jgi:UDP-N-acetylglucosamine enolpyruvyl transferase